MSFYTRPHACSYVPLAARSQLLEPSHSERWLRERSATYVAKHPRPMQRRDPPFQQGGRHITLMEHDITLAAPSIRNALLSGYAADTVVPVSTRSIVKTVVRASLPLNKFLTKSFFPGFATSLLLVVLSGVSGAQADTVYARPGRLVSVGTHRLNLYCMGTGSPTVVFDSGWEDWAPAWSVVQPRVATFTRACAYDRAGAGFSEAGPMPRTSMQIADELHTALQSAGVHGPFILVGHAFGGNNVRTFADRFMPEVAGLVLVEADPSDLEPSEMREREHLSQETIIARLRECRDSVAAGKSLPMLPARPGRPPRTCAQQFFRGLPEAAWSPSLNAKLLELAQSKVAMYDAYISEMEQLPADEEYLAQHRQSLGSRPIRVLSSGAHGVGSLRTLTPEELKYEHEVALAQGTWLQLSSNAKLVIANHSSEYIQFDQPDVVVEAIREVISKKTAAAHPTNPQRVTGIDNPTPSFP
jgi:pimeloyl-ACP methyl ester carboxylesterase